MSSFDNHCSQLIPETCFVYILNLVNLKQKYSELYFVSKFLTCFEKSGKQIKF